MVEYKYGVKNTMIPKEIAAVAEHLGRLEERIEGNARIVENQAVQIATRLEQTIVERNRRFDLILADVADVKNEVKADIAELKNEHITPLKDNVAEIKDILNEGKGMGKIASFMWPPIGGFIAAGIAHFIGFK